MKRLGCRIGSTLDSAQRRSRDSAGRVQHGRTFGQSDFQEPHGYSVKTGQSAAQVNPPPRENFVEAEVLVSKTGLGQGVSLSLLLEQSDDGVTWWPLAGTAWDDVLAVLNSGDKSGRPNRLALRVTEQLVRHDVFTGKGWGEAHELQEGNAHYHQLALAGRLRVTVSTSDNVGYSTQIRTNLGKPPPCPLGQQSASLVGTFAGAQTNSNTTLTTGSRTTVSGTLITVHVAVGNSPTSINVSSDSKGNTYQESIEASFNGTAVRLATDYNNNGTRGASHTCTTTWNSSGAGPNWATITAQEWSGVSSSPTVNTNSASGTGTSASVAVTPSTGTALVVGLASYDAAASDIDVTNGTLAQEQDPGNDTQAQSVGYKVAASGSTTIGWTIGSSLPWGAVVTSFTEDAGAPASSAAASSSSVRSSSSGVSSLPSSSSPFVPPGVVSSSSLLSSSSRSCPPYTGAIDPITMGADLLTYFKSGSGYFQDSAGTIPALATGDPIGQWADRSQYTRPALQTTDASRPTLILNGIGNRSVVRTDGVNDWLVQDAITVINQPLTVFMACTVPSTTNKSVWSQSAATPTFRLTYFSASGGGAWIMAAGSNLSVTGLGTSGWGVIVGKYNGTASKLQRNGVSGTGNAGTGGFTGLVLGALTGGGSGPLAYDIAELFVVQGDLCQSTEDGLAQWLVDLISGSPSPSSSSSPRSSSSIFVPTPPSPSPSSSSLRPSSVSSVSSPAPVAPPASPSSSSLRPSSVSSVPSSPAPSVPPVVSSSSSLRPSSSSPVPPAVSPSSSSLRPSSSSAPSVSPPSPSSSLRPSSSSLFVSVSPAAPVASPSSSLRPSSSSAPGVAPSSSASVRPSSSSPLIVSSSVSPGVPPTSSSSVRPSSSSSTVVSPSSSIRPSSSSLFVSPGVSPSSSVRPSSSSAPASPSSVRSSSSLPSSSSLFVSSSSPVSISPISVSPTVPPSFSPAPPLPSSSSSPGIVTGNVILDILILGVSDQVLDIMVCQQVIMDVAIFKLGNVDVVTL